MKKNGISLEQIQSQLWQINQTLCSPPLEESEVAQIAKSIGKYPTAINASAEEHSFWKSPGTLPEVKYTTPTLDSTSIPEILKDWSLDIAKRMQVPIEFILMPAIVSISSLIGRKIGIFPKQNDNWFVVPNLWGAIIGRPGTFKSPSISEALKPLEKLVSKENNHFEKRLKSYEIEKTITEATSVAIKEQLVKAIKKSNMTEAEALKNKLIDILDGDEVKAPTCKRYKTNDATIEKSGQLFLENPMGLLLVRDELAGRPCSLQKYGREGDREFYLEAWNGYGSYTVDRIGRGTVHIPALCLSIFGGIQPDKLNKHLTENIERSDDGLLQRFQLLIWPELEKKWENFDCLPNAEAEESITRPYAAIDELPVFEKSDGLHFDEESQIIFNQWRTELELIIRSETIKNSHYESHIAKYRSLMPSLALIFCVIKNRGVISNNTLIDVE
ncbi:MAG: DUF3987 domain-containing protein [Oligoflexia bacterium]|nr:DUF3987 domain-containing protein [Oligoflexia bacterium]